MTAPYTEIIDVDNGSELNTNLWGSSKEENKVKGIKNEIKEIFQNENEMVTDVPEVNEKNNLCIGISATYLPSHQTEPCSVVQNNINQNKETFLRLCRFCLKSGQLSLVRYHRPVAATFKYISLKVDLNDNYPKNMCQVCADKIKGFSAFIDSFKGYDPFLYENLEDNEEQMSQRYKNTCYFCLAVKKSGEVKPIKSKLTVAFYNILYQKEIDLLIKKRLLEKICDNCAQCLEDIDLFISQVHTSTAIIQLYIQDTLLSEDKDTIKKKEEKSSLLTCMTCARNFSNSGQLYQHFHRNMDCFSNRKPTFNYDFYFKGKLLNLIVQFKCPKCTSTFESELEVRNHIQTSHTGTESPKSKKIKLEK